MPRPTGTQTRTFVYDATTQRLTSETQPETGMTSYTYNADGTLATKSWAVTLILVRRGLFVRPLGVSKNALSGSGEEVA